MTPEIGTLTEAQAARRLGVGARTLRRWRQQGAVGYSLTPGGRILYTQDDLRQIVQAMRVEPTLGRVIGLT